MFLDANILFSAAKSAGAVRQLLRLLLDAGHECWVDAYVVAEARRNLAAKGPDAMAAFETLLTHLNIGAAQATGPAQKELEWLPEKDRPVLAAAMRLRCNVLVTGDRKHFGSGYGKAFGGVTIHSPYEMGELLLG